MNMFLNRVQEPVAVRFTSVIEAVATQHLNQSLAQHLTHSYTHGVALKKKNIHLYKNVFNNNNKILRVTGQDRGLSVTALRLPKKELMANHRPENRVNSFAFLNAVKPRH